LVADASRRTRKVNAYVSGLGRTRRVVLFDTLLEQTEPAAVELVVAHELGHRRSRHVLKGTLLTIGGVIGLVLMTRIVFGTPTPRELPRTALRATGRGLAARRPAAALSRGGGGGADRFPLELPRAPRTFEAPHRKLALATLGDFAPPWLVYAALF